MNMKTQPDITLYGIRNCDTIKKARRFLENAGIDYRFHDYRTDGVDSSLLRHFVDQLGCEALLNTRGTTWRKLSQESRDAARDEEAALQLMLDQPSVIKRPVLQKTSGELLVGFSENTYQTLIQEKS